jgi:hypothetical protein
MGRFTLSEFMRQEMESLVKRAATAICFKLDDIQQEIASYYPALSSLRE